MRGVIGETATRLVVGCTFCILARNMLIWWTLYLKLVPADLIRDKIRSIELADVSDRCKKLIFRSFSTSPIIENQSKKKKSTRRSQAHESRHSQDGYLEGWNRRQDSIIESSVRHGEAGRPLSSSHMSSFFLTFLSTSTV